MLLTFFLIFHKIIILLVTTDLVVHSFNRFFAAREGLADLGDGRDYLFKFEIMAVMFLRSPAIIAHIGILIAFIIGTDQDYWIAIMFTTPNLDSIQIRSFEHVRWPNL